MKKWSLNGKMIFVISILAVGAIVISTTGIRSMSQINHNIGEMTFEVKKDQMTSQISDHQRMVGMIMRDIIIERDAERMKKLEERFNQTKKDLLKSLEEYTTLTSGEEKKYAEQYRAIADRWFPATDKVVELAKKNLDEEVAAYRNSTEFPMVLEIRAAMAKLNEITAKRIEEAVQKSQDNFDQSRIMMILISCISIIASLALGFVVLKAVAKAIDQVIENLTDSSNQVTSAAQQIASSSEELSQAATEQASSLEETASSIEEMNSMIQKNAENAKRTSDLSNSSHDKAEKGRLVVEDMIKAIDDISVSNTSIMNQIDESNQQISDIVKVISEIGNKTKVINDIVFQTKLLSFNASVEAARAGEHGKGFAVVAEEVGNLAQMSGNAAKEISSMLEGSIQKVEGIVNDTKQKVGHLILDGKAKIETGTVIAKQCGEVLSDIVTNVSNVTQMASEISTACQEQSQGAQEITRAVNQLDQVTQTNAATSEEAASAAEELSSQADSLRATVNVLVQEIKGANGQVNSSHPAPASVSKSKTEKSANVVAISQRKQKSQAPKQNLKKVPGYEGSIPSESDPRFEEV